MDLSWLVNILKIKAQSFFKKSPLKELLQLLASAQVLLKTFRGIPKLTCGESPYQRQRLAFVVDGENGDGVLHERGQAFQRERGDGVDLNLQNTAVLEAAPGMPP